MNTFYDFFMAPLEKKWLARRRSRLISLATGHVLEIGFGTGANLRYYQAGQVTSLTAIDPDVPKSPPDNTGLRVQIEKGHAENLPFPEGSFDTVVETLVLCSVADVNASLSEIYRVLKPGGQFIYMDHVLPENKIWAAVFRAANLLWPHLAHGCQLTRSPHLLIEGHGFSLLDSGSFGRKIFRYGVARKNISP